ncbi:hypothetical protein MAGR_35450 [Mycolicibacterium agri]|uniref:Uncharacterized protein n=1 Tax=Mycolicibacterium agri TaxID=36811 RepID=A0A7I9W323_MYCAG|nr:hypothetical protein MAGR_35450 [Mycolicibacterium agri]
MRVLVLFNGVSPADTPARAKKGGSPPPADPPARAKKGKEGSGQVGDAAESDVRGRTVLRLG